MCHQLVTGWAGDAENWGSPRGASMQEQTLMSMKREGSFIPILKFKER